MKLWVGHEFGTHTHTHGQGKLHFFSGGIKMMALKIYNGRCGVTSRAIRHKLGLKTVDIVAFLHWVKIIFL